MKTTTASDIVEQALDYFEKENIDYAEKYIDYKFTDLTVNDRRGQVNVSSLIMRKSNHSDIQDCTLNLTPNGYSARCSCGCKNEQCAHVVATAYAAFLFLTDDEVKSDITLDKGILRWMDDVNKLIEQKHDNEAHPPKQISQQNKKLVYLLYRKDASWKKNNLYMKPTLIKLNKTGGFSKANPSTIDWFDVLYNKDHSARKFLSEEDWLILFTVSKIGEIDGKESQLTGGKECVDILMRMAATGRCYFHDPHTSPLSWQKKRKGAFQWELNNLGTCQEIHCTTKPESDLFDLDDGYFLYIDKDAAHIGPVTFKEPAELVDTILSAPEVPLEEVETFSKFVDTNMPSLKKIKPPKVKVHEIVTKPKPVIYVDIYKNDYAWIANYFITAMLSFDYGKFNTDDLNDPIRDWSTHISEKGEVFRIKRDITFEIDAAKILQMQKYGCSDFETLTYRYRSKLDEYEAVGKEFLEGHCPKFEEAGFRIEYSPDFPNYEIIENFDWFMETTALEGDTKNDWFGVEMGVMIDGERLNILPLLERIYKMVGADIDDDSTKEFIVRSLDKRKAFVIPKARLELMLKAFALDFESGSLDDKGRLHLSKWSAQYLEEFKLASEKTEVRTLGNDDIYAFGKKLKEFKSIPKVTPSKYMVSTLRPYQKEGLNWMQFLREIGLNGILADDMGLGKTIQVLAHIQKEKDAGRLKDPCLVIAPTSLMFNWKSEVEKHTPQLKALVLHGPKRHCDFAELKNHDIILTTYPLIVRDKKHYINQHFHCLILDEAQMIKNSRTQAYQAIQQLNASHRLCLTGTPMENHLGELWSLFNFLMPGFLGKQKVFAQLFRKPIEKEGDVSQQKVLANRIAPFMMRRTKDLVAKELPEKTEIIREIELDSKQMDLYEMIRIRAHQKMMKEINKKGIERSQIAVLEALLRLRQVCCDPRLVKSEQDIENIPSAKLECLMEMLPQMIEEGRRVLLFSQFTSMLDLIKERLDEASVDYTELTGSTADRRTPVENFQNHKVPLMLLSLKAGGVGLNLTAADTVIHFDPWWNPAVESQATDRAHRIGQKNKVFVYKLVTVGTVEQKILAMQERKRELINSLLESKKSTGHMLTMEDLEDVFKPLGT